MRNLAKGLQGLLAAGVLLAGIVGMTGSAHAATASFNDISSSYAKDQIVELAQAGILSGFQDGGYHPTDPMTRENFAIVLAKTMKLTPNAAAAANFTDVDGYAKPYVGALVSSKVVTGYDATHFGGRDSVTREQLAVFFIRAMGAVNEAKSMVLVSTFADSGSVDEYAKQYVALTQKIGFIAGSSNQDGSVSFNPTANADRQAVARLDYSFWANGSTFVMKINNTVENFNLLSKAAGVVDNYDSYTLGMTNTRRDASGTVTYTDTSQNDYIKSSGAIHGTGTITDASNNSGSPTSYEVYVANGTIYQTLGTNNWYKGTLDGGLDEFMAPVPSMLRSLDLAPYLTYTKQGASFVLNGDIDPREMYNVYPEMGAKWETYQKINFNATFDSATGALTHEILTLTNTDGSTDTYDLQLSNINGVTTPIQVPQTVLDSAQDMPTGS